MTSLFEEVQPSVGDDIPTTRVELRLNGEPKAAQIEPRLLLAHLIRNGFQLTGTHTGCDTTNCGACTVLFDGDPVKSCTMFAVQANGHEVTTVEGLAKNQQLHPIQEGFKDEHGLQCGFCTPGMMLSAVALLNENLNPTEDEVRWALSGNLCRCTGYQNIVKAVLWAAAKMRGEADPRAASLPPDDTAAFAEAVVDEVEASSGEAVVDGAAAEPASEESAEQPEASAEAASAEDAGE